MFSMITFKNLYPKEFAELQAERGIVKQAFQEKGTYVNAEKEKLEELIVPKRKILENVHNDILFGLREIKHAFLGFLSYDNKEKVNWDNLDECCENNVEKEKRKEIWNYLLENSRISSTWKNFESYYNEFGITTELSVWVNENCSDIVKSEKTDKIDNDCIKNIITNSEITVQTVEQIADNYKCDEEIEFDVSKLPVDKINLLIRKHYIRYTVSKIEKIRSLAKDSFGVYCKEYIDDFVNDLPSIPLNEREIVMLLNDTTIDKKYKRGILEKISASSMTENLAKTIANNQFNVDKAYVEYAWKNLDNAGRHMLLVNHLQVYSIAEISRLLTDLGGEWSKLSDNKSRHKEEISIDVNGHNEKLLSQLQRKGFITSYPEKKDREKSFFEVWVKQQ